MKLTPWLRSLKNGISRAIIKQAKVKRRHIGDGDRLLAGGFGAEQLEDRTVLNAVAYTTDYQDGVYDAGNLLQPQPNAPIALTPDPRGVPAIPIRVYFEGPVSVSGSLAWPNTPRLVFNTFTGDSSAANYTGSPGYAYYLGGDVSNVEYLTFWYEIQNGENTPGPLAAVPDLHVVGTQIFGNTEIRDHGTAAVLVNWSVLADSAQDGDVGTIIETSTWYSGSYRKKHIFIDTLPVVQNINSTTADSVPYGGLDGPRPYRVGDDPILIQVYYSEPVSIAGSPELYLQTDGLFGLTGGDNKAVYVSGSGTRVLTFAYVVAPGDNTFDLDVASGNALVLPPGAAIHDQDFVPDNALRNILGPSSGGLVPGRLGQNRSIQVDTLAPKIGPRPDEAPTAAFTGITSLGPNRTYGAGEVITIRMTFNEDVLLTGTPSLVLATGPNNREATYAGFAGTDTLLFTYEVQLGDASLDLDYVNQNSLKLNGGTLTDKAGNAASLLLPVPGQQGSLSFNKNLVIDTDVAVTNVTTSLPDGNYGVGQVIPIQVFFNKPVVVSGSSVPQLILNLDSPTNAIAVNYSSGSGTNILTFNYTIQPGQNSADLDYLSATALQLNGATIVDTVGNGNAILTLPLPGAIGSLGNNKNIKIDTVLPYIKSVSAPDAYSAGTYGVGQTIPITVTFSEPVSVTGSPKITLETNGAAGVQTPQNVALGQLPDAVVSYSSGAGTNTLTFLYTIAPGENSLDLDALTLSLSNALIRDLAQNDLQGGVSDNGALVFQLPQGGNAELLTNVQTTANQSAIAQVNEVTISTANPIVVGETYTVTVTVNPAVNPTTYGPFSTVAVTGDTAATIALRLRQQMSSIPVEATPSNGGQIIRLTARVPGTPFSVTSSVTPVSGSPSGQAHNDDVRPNRVATQQVDTITVNPPVVAGSIYDFTINGTVLTYKASGTDDLNTVASAIAAIINNNVATTQAVIANASGNTITLMARVTGTGFTASVAHALATNRAIVVDTAPIITNVTSTTSDGPYGPGSVIDVSVTFSENVAVSTAFGGPSLVLETNSTPGIQAGDARATYSGGTGTRTIHFSYTVGAGQTSADLDYASVNSLLMNGDAISDLDGAAAALNPVLPTPGARGSLSFNKNIGIDSIDNDPPSVAVPGTQTIIEDISGGLVFSTSNPIPNPIRIIDVDAGVADVEVTLQAYNGTLSLDTIGLTVTGGAVGTSTVTVRGSIDTINARLDGLVFTPTQYANSTNAAGLNTRIVITANDLGNAVSGGGLGTPKTGTSTIPITITPVNNAPVAQNQSIIVTVGTGMPITLTATDVDSPSLTFALDPSVAISLRTAHGTLTQPIGGSLTYTPDAGFVGTDSFSFTASDGLLTSNIGLISITVVPVVSAVGFPDVSEPEGNIGNKAVTLTVTLSQAFDQPVTINYTTVDGTAHAGTDYVAKSGTVTIPAGQLSGTFTVDIIGNLIDEPSKAFSVVLSNPVNATLQDTTAVVTIQNDDGLSISDLNQFETNSGATVFNFTVTLSSPQLQTVTVNYATADGTASRNSDYVSQAGTVTFLPGETSKTVSITVYGDTTDEANETFFVDLSNATGGPSLGKTRGVGTILNDDESPFYTVADPQISEGNAGTKIMTFTVNLSAASGQTVTVNYATSDLAPGANSATAGADYIARSGMLTFLPGQTSQTVTITLIGDQVIESDESFALTLSGATNADTVNSDSSAVGTIVNDDGVYGSDVQVFEGNDGLTYMVFTINAPVGSQNLTVNYTTSDGTATAGVDYTPVSGTLTFGNGVTSRTVSVAIIGDYNTELDETLFLNLSYPQPPASQVPLITPTLTGTIRNDDSPREITVTNVTVEEGDSGTKNAVFTLTLSAPIGVPVTINYNTIAGTATPGSDYIPTSGTVTFDPNQTTKTVSVAIVGDLINEENETFTLHLSNPTFATFAGPDPVATINDNDSQPTVIFNNVSFDEGQTGSKQATITVSLSAASGKTVTMNYRTIDGTAVSTGSNIGDSDYIAQSGTLTFAPGVTSQTITVTINSDAYYELSENFAIELSDFVNVSSNSSTQQRSVTITNDDPLPTVVISDVEHAEGNTGNTAYDFVLTLLAPSAVPATVNYTLGSGTALLGTDFLTTGENTVTFAPGETSKTIRVNVVGETNIEATEFFYVNLSAPTVGATVSVGDALGIGTITNDDFPPSLTIDDVSIVEGDSGPTQLTFTVTRTGSLANQTTVNYSTSNGTATGGLDFLSKTGTLTFQAGIATQTIQIAITGDTLAELDEVFFVNLSSPSNATISDGQGQGTIENDDNFPPIVTVPSGALTANEGLNLSIVGVSVADSDAGSLPISVTLSVAHGTLVVRGDVANGVAADHITNNGTGQVVLSGTIAEINATLASSNGLVYRGFTDFSGSDALTVLANDLGHTGVNNVPKTDTKVVGINVVGVNDAPVIDFTGSSDPTPVPVTSTRGAVVTAFGSPNNVSVTDSDNTNFSGGTLTVSFVSQVSSKDKIAIRKQGKGSGQITLKGKNVTYGGVVIGTVSGGKKGAPLVIQLNSSATAAATTALLKNITFSTPKGRLDASPRSLRAVMSDGKGATSNTIVTTINVTP